MSDIKEKLVKQASKLVCTIADNLSSDGGYTEEGLKERINEYVNDAIDTQDIDNKVEEALENVDFDSKVQDVLDNSCTIVDEDKATELAHEAVSETDWYSVISDNDIATESYVDEIVNERVEAWVDDKLFSVLKDIVLKCFERSAETWMDAIRKQGVSQYKEELEAKKEEEVAVA